MIDLRKKFLIITAHPDDLEMSCAGTVKRILKEGGSVTHWVMVKPMTDVRTNRPQKKVMQELSDSSYILGQDIEIYDTDCYDNGRPKLELTSNLITDLENKCQNFDVMVSHWREDYHQDHKICYQIAAILARKNFSQFICFDQPIYNRFYKEFDKNVYVDISDYVDVKKQALSCYDSYFSQNDIDTILAYNKYNGSFVGENKFAETFNLVYSKQ